MNLSMKNGFAITMLATASFATPARADDPVSLDAFRKLARPAPGVEIGYGPAASQRIDLFLPDGHGPHPLAIVIHGGCWTMTTAGREQLRHLGADLAGRGIAVWSIGYRRADEPGGGYPGTFLDVAQAIDQARREAQRHRFNLGRTVLIGHSAGGHLALWAAARAEIPAPGPLASADPFVPSTIIALAGVGDLERFAPFVPLFCGQGIIEALTRGRTDYADVSPAALPLPEARIVLVSGTLDRLVPPYVAHDYASAHGLAGAERIERVDIAGAGHFDLVTPGTQAWQIVSQRIVQAVSPPVPQVSR